MGGSRRGSPRPLAASEGGIADVFSGDVWDGWRSTSQERVSASVAFFLGHPGMRKGMTNGMMMKMMMKRRRRTVPSGPCSEWDTCMLATSRYAHGLLRLLFIFLSLSHPFSRRIDGRWKKLHRRSDGFGGKDLIGGRGLEWRRTPRSLSLSASLPLSFSLLVTTVKLSGQSPPLQKTFPLSFCLSIFVLFV